MLIATSALWPRITKCQGWVCNWDSKLLQACLSQTTICNSKYEIYDRNDNDNDGTVFILYLIMLYYTKIISN